MINRKYRRLEKALVPCMEFGSWCSWYSGADQLRAKMALINFFRVLLDMPCEKRLMHNGIWCEKRGDYEFYRDIRRIRSCLRGNDFAGACNELITLCEYENSILQKRIYVCMERLYHEYLEV